jgi:hypothetical protein
MAGHAAAQPGRRRVSIVARRPFVKTERRWPRTRAARAAQTEPIAVRPHHAGHGLLSLGEPLGPPLASWRPEGVIHKAQPDRVRCRFSAVGAVCVGARSAPSAPICVRPSHQLARAWNPTSHTYRLLSRWPRLLHCAAFREGKPGGFVAKLLVTHLDASSLAAPWTRRCRRRTLPALVCS